MNAWFNIMAECGHEVSSEEVVEGGCRVAHKLGLANFGAVLDDSFAGVGGLGSF